MTSYRSELAAAYDIAREAAALVELHKARGLTVEHKAGDEPVTEADRAASALIVGRLRAAFPHDAILSEESPDDGTRLTHERVWMVDPIDGTRDFIDGSTGYAVMIGLCVGGRPQMGVVAQPATGATWAGSVGEEVWKETSPGGVRVPLRTSSISAAPGIRLVASKSHRTGHIDAFRKALSITDEMNIGGVGLKVGLVADASRDLYVYPGNRTKVWDTCAPEAILHAAGGKLTDVRGTPLDYRAATLYNTRGILASNGPLHELTLKTLANLVREIAR